MAVPLDIMRAESVPPVTDDLPAEELPGGPGATGAPGDPPDHPKGVVKEAPAGSLSARLIEKLADDAYPVVSSVEPLCGHLKTLNRHGGEYLAVADALREAMRRTFYGETIEAVYKALVAANYFAIAGHVAHGEVLLELAEQLERNGILADKQVLRCLEAHLADRPDGDELPPDVANNLLKALEHDHALAAEAALLQRLRERGLLSAKDADRMQQTLLRKYENPSSRKERREARAALVSLGVMPPKLTFSGELARRWEKTNGLHVSICCMFLVGTVILLPMMFSYWREPEKEVRNSVEADLGCLVVDKSTESSKACEECANVIIHVEEIGNPERTGEARVGCKNVKKHKNAIDKCGEGILVGDQRPCFFSQKRPNRVYLDKRKDRSLSYEADLGNRAFLTFFFPSLLFATAMIFVVVLCFTNSCGGSSSSGDCGCGDCDGLGVCVCGDFGALC